MKIIEALKELPLLNKRIDKNISLIQGYSSDLDRGTHTDLPFGSVENQKKEVDSLLQSTKDLVRRKAYLRKQLQVTNAQVIVTIGDEKLSIAEWIEYREGGIKKLIATQQSLNDNNAENKIRTTQVDLSEGVKKVRFYDEKGRNEEILRLENIQGNIDAQLEIINATTDLIE